MTDCRMDVKFIPDQFMVKYFFPESVDYKGFQPLGAEFDPLRADCKKPTRVPAFCLLHFLAGDSNLTMVIFIADICHCLCSARDKTGNDRSLKYHL